MSAAWTSETDASALVETVRFDELTRAEATRLVQSCCASRRWVNEVVSGRPYGSLRRVLTASADVVSDLSWSDVAQAVAAHPRIRVQAARAETDADREAVRAELHELVRLRLVVTLR